MTFSLLCNKQSGGQTPGPLRFNHICKDARSRPLTNGMSDLSNVKEIPLEDEIFDRKQCYGIENTVSNGITEQ